MWFEKKTWHLRCFLWTADFGELLFCDLKKATWYFRWYFGQLILERYIFVILIEASWDVKWFYQLILKSCCFEIWKKLLDILDVFLTVNFGKVYFYLRCDMYFSWFWRDVFFCLKKVNWDVRYFLIAEIEEVFFCVLKKATLHLRWLATFIIFETICLCAVRTARFFKNGVVSLRASF